SPPAARRRRPPARRPCRLPSASSLLLPYPVLVRISLDERGLPRLPSVSPSSPLRKPIAQLEHGGAAGVAVARPDRHAPATAAPMPIVALATHATLSRRASAAHGRGLRRAEALRHVGELHCAAARVLVEELADPAQHRLALLGRAARTVRAGEDELEQRLAVELLREGERRSLHRAEQAARGERLLGVARLHRLPADRLAQRGHPRD